MAQPTLKSIATDKTDMYCVAYEDLAIEEGFNARFDEGEIDGLAKSIASTGLKLPLTVRMAKNDAGEVKAFITDGHRRHKAIPIAIEKYGANKAILKSIRVISENFGSNEEERTLGLIVRNSGKPLDPLEMAHVCARLISQGMKIDQIAAAAGKTQKAIRELLELNSASKEIRDAVGAGTLSTTAAKQLAAAEPAVQKRVLAKAAALAEKAEALEVTAPAGEKKPQKKERIKVSDIQKEVKGTPDMISAKSLRDLRAKVVKVQAKSGVDAWEAVIYGIDLCLGKAEIEENRF